LAESFAGLVRNLWQERGQSYAPRDLHELLKRKNPEFFQGGPQQDVQEFLCYILNELHEELNLVVPKPANAPKVNLEDRDQQDAEETRGRCDEFSAGLCWLRYLQTGKSFLVDLLQAVLYWSLPLSKSMTEFGQAIKKYMEEEVLTGGEQWDCPACKCKVDAIKRLELLKLPPVLVLTLKRFEFDPATAQIRKIENLLKTPLSIDFAPFVSSWQREGTVYDVVAVANHFGEYGSGHYTSYCRLPGLGGPRVALLQR